MGEKTFKMEDREYLVEVLHQQFINYYRLVGGEMSLSERLFFEDIEKMIEGGFAMKIGGEL